MPAADFNVMARPLVFAFAAVFLFAIPASAGGPREAGCDNVKTTIEGIECRTKQMQTADDRLQRYLQAATLRAEQLGLDPKALITEQVLWRHYRDQHCGNVYRSWGGGTIRHDMSAQCLLRLTRMRTYEIWAAYLTFMDSTPPVLPDPSR